MSHAMQKREAAMALLYCFFLSLAALLICTKSSPLYPVNDWSDANIFLTMGKGMLRGKVLYRDLYDHKGPLLYGLHALAAMISSTSFLGVFLLEVAAFTAFLMSAWKIVRLYGVNGAAWPLLAVLAAGVLSSTALQAGDSAEELCLPLVSWSLYLLLKWLHRNDLSAPGRKWALFQGVLTGCVLWIKFTMLGFFGAVMLTALIRLVYRGQWKQAFSCVGWFLLGLLLTTLPWILYFGVNSGIGIWLKTYFYDNLFLYGGSKTSLAERVKEILKCLRDTLLMNRDYSLFLLLGLGWFSFSRKTSGWEKAAVWSGAGLLTLGIFWGGTLYLYYGLVLAVFAIAGLIALGRLLEKLVLPKIFSPWVKRLGCCVICVLSLGYCLLYGDNTSQLLKPYESTMQYQLKSAAEMDEKTTLLNYGFMDAGFYLAFDVLPSEKYFCQTNVPLAEMLEEQQRYVREGLMEYVVARNEDIPTLNPNYRLVKVADSPTGFWYEHVYLYRLTKEAGA